MNILYQSHLVKRELDAFSKSHVSMGLCSIDFQSNTTPLIRTVQIAVAFRRDLTLLVSGGRHD